MVRHSLINCSLLFKIIKIAAFIKIVKINKNKQKRSIYLRVVSNMEKVFTIAKSGHLMEGYTLVGDFIVFAQDMQEFGALGVHSDTSFSLVMLSKGYVGQVTGNTWPLVQYGGK